MSFIHEISILNYRKKKLMTCPFEKWASRSLAIYLFSEWAIWRSGIPQLLKKIILKSLFDNSNETACGSRAPLLNWRAASKHFLC